MTWGNLKRLTKMETLKMFREIKFSVLTDKMDISNELQGGSFQSEKLDPHCLFISVGSTEEIQASKINVSQMGR